MPRHRPQLLVIAQLLFIHGLLSDERIGSCSSLPVLYVAVGRRLGYPVNLALAVQHMFIRWEGEREAFNMEGSGPDFINTHPSEHYIDSPRPWTDEEKTCGAFLRSITAREELAAFLYMRETCLTAHDRWTEALPVMHEACRLHPGDPHYRQELDRVQRKIAYNRMHGILCTLSTTWQHLISADQLDTLKFPGRTPWY